MPRPEPFFRGRVLTPADVMACSALAPTIRCGTLEETLSKGWFSPYPVGSRLYCGTLYRRLNQLRESACNSQKTRLLRHYVPLPVACQRDCDDDNSLSGVS